MDQKIDKGFCMLYWRLSYRRKFIRTLWVGLFSFLFFLLPSDFAILGVKRNIFISFVLALLLIQALYNLFRWKSEKGKGA
jgi:hypothetical protein